MKPTLDNEGIKVCEKTPYISPDIEVVMLLCSDVIRTSGEWDLPEMPLEGDPLQIK